MYVDARNFHLPGYFFRLVSARAVPLQPKLKPISITRGAQRAAFGGDSVSPRGIPSRDAPRGLAGTKDGEQ